MPIDGKQRRIQRLRGDTCDLLAAHHDLLKDFAHEVALAETRAILPQGADIAQIKQRLFNIENLNWSTINLG